MNVFLFILMVSIFITFVLLFIIKFIPMEKANRRKLVLTFKTFYLVEVIVLFAEFVFIELWTVEGLYRLNYFLIYLLSKNDRFASYIALTLALLFSGPILALIMKLIKKEQYLKQLQGRGEFEGFDKNNNMQSLYYELVNILQDNMLYRVGVHTINAVLIIWINISKCFEVETEISSTNLYMAIVTFYAIDKITTYLIENHRNLWDVLDNKLFLTKEIDDGIHFGFKDLIRILDVLYENYIETGKFELPEYIANEFSCEEKEHNHIRFLTLNINGGRELIDNSLNNYIDEIDADYVVLQEVQRRNIINRQVDFPGYRRFLPTKCVDTEVDILKMNGKRGYTLLFAKEHIVDLYRDDSKDSGVNRNRCYVKVKNGELSILGVHILLEDQDKLISNIGECGCDIIAGDFNASIKKKDNPNWQLLERMTGKEYENLWQKGVREKRAYYVDYQGEKQVSNDEQNNTFASNTHIDYILGRKDTIELEEIFVDMRTLAFTDHCAIVADLKINNTALVCQDNHNAG